MKRILCVYISSTSTYRSIPIICRVFWYHIYQICNDNKSYRNVCNMSFASFRPTVDWTQWRHKALLKGSPRLSLALGPAPARAGPACKVHISLMSSKFLLWPLFCDMCDKSLSKAIFWWNVTFELMGWEHHQLRRLWWNGSYSSLRNGSHLNAYSQCCFITCLLRHHRLKSGFVGSLPVIRQDKWKILFCSIKL